MWYVIVNPASTKKKCITKDKAAVEAALSKEQSANPQATVFTYESRKWARTAHPSHRVGEHGRVA